MKTRPYPRRVTGVFTDATNRVQFAVAVLELLWADENADPDRDPPSHAIVRGDDRILRVAVWNTEDPHLAGPVVTDVA